MGQGPFNKLGAENHGSKATTLAPVNQGFVSSRLGLHAKQRQEYHFLLTWFSKFWNSSGLMFSKRGSAKFISGAPSPPMKLGLAGFKA